MIKFFVGLICRIKFWGYFFFLIILLALYQHERLVLLAQNMTWGSPIIINFDMDDVSQVVVPKGWYVVSRKSHYDQVRLPFNVYGFDMLDSEAEGRHLILRKPNEVGEILISFSEKSHERDGMIKRCKERVGCQVVMNVKNSEDYIYREGSFAPLGFVLYMESKVRLMLSGISKEDWINSSRVVIENNRVEMYFDN
ncbi:MAG: hypothetical protein Q8K94_05755 [Moraxellaceae bacterium]|nr:hypothetical protein [Moraxellaceae bacterium]MDP1776107.1 hypothetical protein [Moraxellaceae bacterium]